MSRIVSHGGVKVLREKWPMILIAAFLFCAMSSVPETYGAEMTLRFATLQAPGNSLAVQTVKGLNAITERTKGSIKWQIHYGTESGFQAKEYIYAMGKGLLDGAMAGHGASSLEYPVLNINGLFFLLPDMNQREPAMDAVKPIFDEFYREQGVVPLAYSLYFDAWSILYSTKNIASASDLRGMLIRIYDPATTLLVKGLGGTPVSLQKSEVYMGLQKKTIDGAITDSGAVKDMKFSEVCKYMVKFQPNFNANMIGMSKKTWDKLSAEQKKIVQEVFANWEKSTWARVNSPAEQEDGLDYGRKNGVTILDLPADVKAMVPKLRKEQIDLYLAKGGDRGKRMVKTIDSLLAKQK